MTTEDWLREMRMKDERLQRQSEIIESLRGEIAQLHKRSGFDLKDFDPDGIDFPASLDSPQPLIDRLADGKEIERRKA
jgi:hypothetical protein